MSKGTLSIHSENILPIIKKWLYSEKEIFARELISNASDAIHKLKILRDRGECEISDDEFRIDVKIDKEAKTLRFIDTGIGMTADEIEKYIAQLAFSGAEEFVQKYKSEDESDQMIGHFGLGFYSAYMVAHTVEIDSLSYTDGASAAHWTCDGSSEFTLDAGKRETRGTEITLHIDADSEEYLEAATLRGMLAQFSSFLPYPIYVEDELINTREPLWLRAPSECKDEDYLDFFRHLYPMEPDPLFWIHLNVDYPFNLKGILYFPKMKRDHDFSRTAIKLYCNRVYVSEDCKDLIPEYLMMLKGAIDSPDIPLNVSRSYLQTDKTVRQVSTHIAKKVCDRLSTLYKTEQKRFLDAWPDIELIVKLGALQDDKFYAKAKDFLVWKNTNDEWTTVEQYIERNKEALGDRIFYTSDERHQTQFLDLYKNKGIEVLYTKHLVDTHLISFLEQKVSPAKFQRIDASVDDAILDKDREDVLVDEDGKTAAAKIAEWVRSKIKQENVEVEAKSLASDAIPAFVMMDEQGRRMRDFMLQNNPEMPTEALSAFNKQTFVVNTNSALIQSAQNLDAKHPELAEAILQQIYQLALLGQREMDAEALNAFVKDNMNVLQNLSTLASEQ